MLAKKNRISRQFLNSFKSVESKPKFTSSEHFSLRALPSPNKEPHVSVSVSKKIAKSAVVRNRIRRRVYSAVQGLLPKLKNNLFLISAKRGSEDLQGEELWRELSGLLI